VQGGDVVVDRVDDEPERDRALVLRGAARSSIPGEGYPALFPAARIG